MEDTLTVGCRNRFHRPDNSSHKHDYNLLVPQRYMAIKDDIPGFYLNEELHPNSENPKTLPFGYDYEVPLSLNAETNLSEFRNKEKPPTTAQGKSNTQVQTLLDDLKDLSDLLYNAYGDAQKHRQVIKKIKRMKSQSPPRPTKSPGRHKSPGRNKIVANINR